MSKYGFNPDELIDTKVELIDKDGFHKVGEVPNDGGNSGGNSTYDYNGPFNSFIVFNNGGKEDPDSEQQGYGYGGYGSLTVLLEDTEHGEGGPYTDYILIYYAEPKHLKNEYSSWDEFINDIGIDKPFSMGEITENTLNRAYEDGEATSGFRINGSDTHGLFCYCGLFAATKEPLGNKVPNCVAIHSGSHLTIDNDGTGHDNGPFTITHVIGMLVDM